MKLDINKPFADYRLIRLMGQSDMTCVYEAETSKGKHVFLKIHDKPKFINAGKNSALNEASLSRKLNNNKAFLKLQKSGTVICDNQELIYLCYEYFDYQYLRDYIAYHNFDEKMAFKVIHKILQGLITLRDATGGCCHFNISPENIIFNTQDCIEPQPYIIGLDHVSTPSNGNPDFITKDIDVCFRAPETFYGWFSPAANVYSVGLVLYYMIMCKLPYPIDYAMDTESIRKIVRQTKITTDVFSNEAAQIIQKALNVNALSRYCNVEEFDRAVMMYLDSGANSIKNEDDDYNIFDEDYSIFDDEYDDYHDDCDNNEEDDEDEENEANNNAAQGQNAKLNVKFSVKHGDGFKAVVGMDDIKERLYRDFIEIISNPKLAKDFCVNPSNMLLFGPPGCGKSYLCEKLCEEVNLPSCQIKPSDLGSIWIHGSQSLIKALFERAEKEVEKNHKGVLIVIEEFDAVTGGKRTAQTNDCKNDEIAEWLAQLNKCMEKHIYIVGSTNRIDQIDDAILRSGRINQIVYIGMPDLECRKQIFELELKKRPHKKDIDLDNLAAMTEGFTSSDISKIVEEAAKKAFKANVHSKGSRLIKINEEMLVDTINKTCTSLTPDKVMAYEKMRDEFFNDNKKQRRAIGFIPQTKKITY